MRGTLSQKVSERAGGRKDARPHQLGLRCLGALDDRVAKHNPSRQGLSAAR